MSLPPSLACAAVLAALPAFAACPPPPQAGAHLGEGPLQMAWQADPKVIVAQRPFALIVQVCPEEARLLRVDATMPEHGHGMNYGVSLRPQGAGRWRAEGLLWHMSGRWELSFELEAAGQTHRLAQSVTLK